MIEPGTLVYGSLGASFAVVVSSTYDKTLLLWQYADGGECELVEYATPTFENFILEGNLSRTPV